MRRQLLIVEDEFIEANNLRRILKRAGYAVLEIAMSVPEALCIIQETKPDMVLLDIFLKGPQTGFHLAETLGEMNIPFVYLSANSDSEVMMHAKKTQPYGFLVKPFREKDVLVMLEIAQDMHRQKLMLNKVRLKPAASTALASNEPREVVGESEGLKQVLHLVKVVAPSETSVLILGENGTGKEAIVERIHALSCRAGKPLIKVNCASLPINLIESELFGHERGAFTGATERRLGRFEQANGGTIFLDEIGEMPPELQVKLLRVLQEKEIDRVGSQSGIKVDVRVIAATNRILEKDVADGRFRMDLFYRLNVFPITLPPLRERREDIPLLVEHFLNQFNRKLGKNIEGFSVRAMSMMQHHHWPGNIRELENFVERSMLMADTNIIPHAEFPVVYGEIPMEKSGDKLLTMEENEIEHIRRVLRISRGKVSGPDGAAVLLNLPYSTLISKIKRFGIDKMDI